MKIFEWDPKIYTVCVIKPNLHPLHIKRCIISILEENGLRVEIEKLIGKGDEEDKFVELIYKSFKGKYFYDRLCNYMKS